MATTMAPMDDHSRGPELLAIIWVFTSLAIITVMLKIYTRYRIIKETGVDDILIFFSLILIVICTILFTVDVEYGMGRHTALLSPENAVLAVKINYIANPFGIMAYSIPNIAVAIFIDRILVLRTWSRALLYGLVVAQNVIAAVSCVLLFVQCLPTESLWNPMVKPDKCLDIGTLSRYSYFVGAFTAFTDVTLAVVPAVRFYRLQMRPKAKAAASILLSMTAIAAICAIVKTTKLDELTQVNDFTYATVDLIITAVVEANVIIIAACIPSLNPFVRAVRETISESRARRAAISASKDSGARLIRSDMSLSNFTGKSPTYKTEISSSRAKKSQASSSRLDSETYPDAVIRKTDISTTVSDS